MKLDIDPMYSDRWFHWIEGKIIIKDDDEITREEAKESLEGIVDVFDIDIDVDKYFDVDEDDFDEDEEIPFYLSDIAHDIIPEIITDVLNSTGSNCNYSSMEIGDWLDEDLFQFTFRNVSVYATPGILLGVLEKSNLIKKAAIYYMTDMEDEIGGMPWIMSLIRYDNDTEPQRRYFNCNIDLEEVYAE